MHCSGLLITPVKCSSPKPQLLCQLHLSQAHRLMGDLWCSLHMTQEYKIVILINLHWKCFQKAKVGLFYLASLVGSRYITIRLHSQVQQVLKVCWLLAEDSSGCTSQMHKCTNRNTHTHTQPFCITQQMGFSSQAHLSITQAWSIIRGLFPTDIKHGREYSTRGSNAILKNSKAQHLNHHISTARTI